MLMEKSNRKAELLQKIEELEKNGLWHEDADEDPETYPLMPDDVDYLNEKFTNKIKSAAANFLGQRFFEKMIKQKQLIIKEVKGIENFQSVKGGKFVTCNHFSISDNYAVWRTLRKHMHGKMLYKVIREGNYTNPPPPFGLFMRHCNTLPLSSRLSTMKKFSAAVSTLLQRGQTILIYPEQGMWWNYRKPRPMQEGAFYLAAKNGAPIVPIFITMEDSDVTDGDGYPVQEYTVNFLPAIYPDKALSPANAAKKMKEENYVAWVKTYEEFYKKPLVYDKI